MSNSIDWKKDMKDTMWSMFWLKENAGGNNDADREELKQCVARLIRMATQKTAGQRGAADHIDWNALEHTMLTICCCATSLALAGEFGPMPDTIDG